MARSRAATSPASTLRVPFCLVGSLFRHGLAPARPNCFVANDNVTATNYEVGPKGQPLDSLQMSIAVFYTDYSDLPYQVSTTRGRFQYAEHHRGSDLAGRRVGKHLAPTDNFRLHATLGYIDADVDDPNPAAVAPLTPGTDRIRESRE